MFGTAGPLGRMTLPGSWGFREALSPKQFDEHLNSPRAVQIVGHSYLPVAARSATSTRASLVPSPAPPALTRPTPAPCRRTWPVLPARTETSAPGATHSPSAALYAVREPSKRVRASPSWTLVASPAPSACRENTQLARAERRMTSSAPTVPPVRLASSRPWNVRGPTTLYVLPARRHALVGWSR